MVQSVEKSERNEIETGTLQAYRRRDYISDLKHFVETCCTLLNIGNDPRALLGVGKMHRYWLTSPSLPHPASEVVEVVSPVGGL